jgi:hypothetical protein
MKKLLLALLAAGFASATVGVLAADKEPYTAQPKIEKPGRAADDASGTTPPKSTTSHKKSSKKKKSTAPAPATDAPKQ